MKEPVIRLETFENNLLLEALGLRLSGFYNIVFGDPDTASRELFSVRSEFPLRDAEEKDDSFHSGRKMLRVFIDQYELISGRAEWKSRWPYACAVSVNTWFDEPGSNPHHEKIFRLALKVLFDMTESPVFPDCPKVTAAKILIEEDFPVS